MDVSTSSPSIGFSIPGSATRRLKTYSVSLREKNFDISEVPVVPTDDGENLDHFISKTAKDKCGSCGQKVPKPESARGSGSNQSSPSSQLSRSLPTDLKAKTRLGYDSLNDSNGGSSHSGSLEHCHGERVVSASDTKAKKKLIIASVLCLIFMVGEIAGGYLANSLAIATDAAHLLTDFASFMISLFSLWVATRPATKKMSFGWYRAEVIGALTSVLMIWVVTGVLVYLAVERLISGEYDINAEVMLITSGIGVAFNIVMGCTLHQHGHSHGGSGHGHSHSHGGGEHGHSHQHQSEDLENQPLLTHSHSSHSHSQAVQENINVRAAFIHVVGDFVQSIGVFIAALIIYFKPTWVIVDPICTFLFSVLVLFTTVTILRDALTVLMEGLPRGLDFNEVTQTFTSIEGVIRVHNLRIWALSMDKTALSAHLAIRPGVKMQQVLLQASRLVRSRYNIFEMTLQVEEFEAGMSDCTQCQDPLD